MFPFSKADSTNFAFVSVDSESRSGIEGTHAILVALLNTTQQLRPQSNGTGLLSGGNIIFGQFSHK